MYDPELTYKDQQTKTNEELLRRKGGIHSQAQFSEMELPGSQAKTQSSREKVFGPVLAPKKSLYEREVSLQVDEQEKLGRVESRKARGTPLDPYRKSLEQFKSTTHKQAVKAYGNIVGPMPRKDWEQAAKKAGVPVPPTREWWVDRTKHEELEPSRTGFYKENYYDWSKEK